MRRVVAILAMWLALAGPAPAINPDEILADPALEARARELSKGLRCVKCRNQSIDDSNAAIARDMRIAVRERLVAGDSDDEAVAFLVARYGIYILLNPPVNRWTWVLWVAPGVLLVVTAAGFATLWRRRPEPGVEPEIDSADRALLDALLNDGDRPA